MAYHWHKKHAETLSRGEKAADTMRNSMGSWTFVFGFLIIMLAWAFLNMIVLKKPFDPYPFILLNLLLSTLAGLQGAILLIAAKRQDSISVALAEHDYQTNIKAEKEIRNLKKILENQDIMIAEIHKGITIDKV